MSVNDPFAQNILGVQQLVGSRTNKLNSGAVNEQEGVESEKINELSLELDDSELIALAKKWEIKYAPYEEKIKIRQQQNLTYYLGRQKQGGANVALDGRPISANIIFEAEETFLPAAMSKNPEPVVWSDNSEEGNKISRDVKTMLQFHADRLVLRQKLQLMTRKWSVDFLGVLKHGWDAEIGEIKTEVRDAKNFIFDVNGYVDCYGDFVGYLGERITTTAEKLVEMFPKHRDFIVVMVDGKMGTECVYTEWWTDKFCFYTFKGRVLDKSKNPNFNYDVEEPSLIEGGQPTITKGSNHFSIPKKPYAFLSVFSLGEHPHDDTGLIEQNIPNQDRITRRTEQIDLNLSKANNSDVFSETNFNQETAKQAAKAFAQGHPVLIPPGTEIGKAVARLQGVGVGSDFFTELENSKNDLRSIFGIQGITASRPDEDETARGMILNQQHDNTRIGGGIGDKLEQVADNVFNYWVQLYYVFYDEPHYAAIMGRERAVEYVTLSSADLNRKLVVSVSPDSMKKKDEVSEMNMAQTLWDKGALDPKTLLTILDFPDPQKTAGQVMLYKTNPMAYFQLNFPDVLQQIQGLMASQAPQATPVDGGSQVTPESPPDTLAADPASAALSQVPLPA